MIEIILIIDTETDEKLRLIISQSFSHSCQTDTIFTDFEKAFDSIDQSLLIIKLKKIWFSNSLLS